VRKIKGFGIERRATDVLILDSPIVAEVVSSNRISNHQHRFGFDLVEPFESGSMRDLAAVRSVDVVVSLVVVESDRRISFDMWRR
jgi:hypothetical protein